VSFQADEDPDKSAHWESLKDHDKWGTPNASWEAPARRAPAWRWMALAIAVVVLVAAGLVVLLQ
jgi:hypothetical protein